MQKVKLEGTKIRTQGFASAEAAEVWWPILTSTRAFIKMNNAQFALKMAKMTTKVTISSKIKIKSHDLSSKKICKNRVTIFQEPPKSYHKP